LASGWIGLATFAGFGTAAAVVTTIVDAATSLSWPSRIVIGAGTLACLSFVSVAWLLGHRKVKPLRVVLVRFGTGYHLTGRGSALVHIAMSFANPRDNGEQVLTVVNAELRKCKLDRHVVGRRIMAFPMAQEHLPIVTPGVPLLGEVTAEVPGFADDDRRPLQVRLALQDQIGRPYYLHSVVVPHWTPGTGPT
jgi:hypothetical protein